MKLYSILIPVYNAEKYLRRCLNSIANQHVKNFSYEVLLYNDASTDSSGKICDYYRNKYPCMFRVIHGKINQGSVIGRKKLYEEAQGDIILWIDADDYMPRNSLYEIDKAFKRYHCDMVIYEFYICYYLKFGIRLSRRRVDFKENILFHGNELTKLYNFFAKGKCNNLWRKAFKREMFERIEYKGINLESINVGEDLFLSLPVFDNSKAVVYLHKPLYYYVKNRSSMIHSTSLIRGWKSINIVWAFAEPYYTRWNVIDSFCESIIGFSLTYLKQIKLLQHDMGSEEIIKILEYIADSMYFRMAIERKKQNIVMLKYVYEKDYEHFLNLPTDYVSVIKNLFRKVIE